MSQLTCIACEHGEHGTIINDLAGRLMKCDCTCHRQLATHPTDPLLPNSKTQSLKALLLETPLPDNPDPWWYRVFTKLDDVFNPWKEQA